MAEVSMTISLQADLVITEDLLGRAVVSYWETSEPESSFLQDFFCATRRWTPLPLARNPLTEGVQYYLSQSFARGSRQFASQSVRLGILDIERHFLYSTLTSSFLQSGPFHLKWARMSA
jgi:hypothetical protein